MCCSNEKLSEIGMADLKEYYNLKRKILINFVSAGSALVTVIVTSSFMKFYTDVVGLSPATYGVIFLIFSIWNGIKDPIIGYWADKRPFTSSPISSFRQGREIISQAIFTYG